MRPKPLLLHLRWRWGCKGWPDLASPAALMELQLAAEAIVLGPVGGLVMHLDDAAVEEGVAAVSILLAVETCETHAKR